MESEIRTVEDYVKRLSEDRRVAVSKIREILKESLPEGFEECISYGMIGYVVPMSIYPAGYHVDPSLPLPFINLASQKSFIALYHMGIYADKDLLAWFQKAYQERVPTKLDMGKSCIRFKNLKNIPYDLISDLAKKMTPKDWIKRYEQQINRK